MDIRFLFNVILFIAVCLCLPVSDISGHESIPVSLISMDQGTYSICVDKSQQRLHLFAGRDEVLSLPCSTGMNPGDKQIEGDRRTPEGIYFFKEILHDEELPGFYGWRAYVLNYPNPIDVARKKNGNGIWIHGRIIPLDSTDTKGCISLTNDDLKKLSGYLKAYRTPIISIDDMIYIDKDSINAMEKVYTNFIHSWLDAWANKDVERYRSCYSPRFTDTLRGDDLDTYIERKQQTFEKYDYISILTNGIRIVGADGYVIGYFLMDFAGGGFQSSGVKFVYLENGRSGPKILAEEFLPLKNVPYWEQEANELMEKERDSLMAFLDTWKTSWETKDLDKMKDCYAWSFPSRDEYFARKQRNLEPYRDIQVMFDDIETNREGVYWELRARQKFTSDCYQDTGMKELQLIRTNKGFFITGEKWERIYEES